MTRATLLTESLMRLSPLMGERKQENGVYLPTVYQMVFGCVSCSQFLLPPKKKKKVRLHTDFGSEKIRHRLIVLYHDVASVWLAIHN